MAFATFMPNAHEGRGNHTESDKNLIFLPVKPDLRLDEADSLLVRILVYLPI